MKNCFATLIFFMLAASTTYAQKVFSVKYESQADVKVFVVKYESQADLLVFKEKYETMPTKHSLKIFENNLKVSKLSLSLKTETENKTRIPTARRGRRRLHIWKGTS